MRPLKPHEIPAASHRAASRAPRRPPRSGGTVSGRGGYVSCRPAVPAAPAELRTRVEGLVRPFRDLYPFATQLFEQPGGWMSMLDEGSPGAPPLLCVHGNPSWSILYRHVAREFSGSYRVLAPDHLGCGLSEQPAGWTYRLEDHVANLERIVLEMDLRDVTLVVHDWGGPIGLSVATRHPERFARIVITNTGAFPSELLPARIAMCRGPILGRAMVEGLNGFARAATFMAVEQPMSRQLRRAYVAPYASPRSAHATWRFVDDIPMSADHPSWPALARLSDALPSLDGIPTLLLWGERDWCFTPAYREEFSRRLPHARVRRLEQAGHYLFEDDPEAVSDALRGFFEAHPIP